MAKGQAQLRQATFEQNKHLTMEQHAIVVADTMASAIVEPSCRIVAARGHQRRLASMKRNDRDLDAKAILEWEGTDGSASLRALGQSARQLPLHNLKPIPNVGARMFEWRPDLHNSAGAFVATAMSTPGSGILTGLDSEWARMHRTVNSSEPQLASEAQRPLSKCCKTGFCICRGPGALIGHIFSRCLQLVKNTFKAGTEDRQLLLDGRIVARLVRGDPICVEDPLLSEDYQPETWWHIAYASRQPWSLALHQLVRSDSHPPIDDGRHRCFLQVPSLEGNTHAQVMLFSVRIGTPQEARGPKP